MELDGHMVPGRTGIVEAEGPVYHLALTPRRANDTWGKLGALYTGGIIFLFLLKRIRRDKNVCLAHSILTGRVRPLGIISKENRKEKCTLVL